MFCFSDIVFYFCAENSFYVAINTYLSLQIMSAQDFYYGRLIIYIITYYVSLFTFGLYGNLHRIKIDLAFMQTISCRKKITVQNNTFLMSKWVLKYNSIYYVSDVRLPCNYIHWLD